jgi:tRNA threonylcarbamoyladenosine biosynthesis protein TsaB
MEITPHILAVDSSTSVLRVGLSLADGKIASLENRDRYRHAEFIFKLIDRLLTENNIRRSDLRALLISVGPGSFTGLRVGMASVKGLAIARSLPVVGLSNYNILAAPLFRKFGETVLLIPSRRDEFYFGLITGDSFDDTAIIVLPAANIISHAGDRPILTLDSDVSQFDFKKNVIESGAFSWSIRDLLIAGEKKLHESGGDDLTTMEPIYVQKFSAPPKK